ncbi:50S ribosomal protein L35 [candidate division WWE3 bacterium]|nr:50S ribosomal protein L35 [candidate division WWE3 bacterium]
MPKLKTKRTAMKRIKITKNGKILRKNVSTSHLKRKWSANKKTRKNLGGQVLNIGHKNIFKQLLHSHARKVK